MRAKIFIFLVIILNIFSFFIFTAARAPFTHSIRNDMIELTDVKMQFEEASYHTKDETSLRNLNIVISKIEKLKSIVLTAEENLDICLFITIAIAAFFYLSQESKKLKISMLFVNLFLLLIYLIIPKIS